MSCFRVCFATPRKRKTFRRGTTRALARARSHCSRIRASLAHKTDRDNVADGAPRRPRARPSPHAKTARCRATRAGSPPEPTRRVARLQPRIHHRLTTCAFPLTRRRFKCAGEDHAEATGRHGGGLRCAGASPSVRVTQGTSTRLGNAEPRPSRSFLTRPPRRSGTEAKARTTPTTTRMPKGTTSSRRAARLRSS